MKNPFNKILRILLPVFIGVFFIYLSIKNTSPEDREVVIINIKNADYRFILLSLIFGLLSHLSRAYRWKFMLNPMGYSPSFFNSLLSIFIAYLSNLAIPRSGEIARATIMTKYENIPFEKAFGTIIAERIIDLIILFLFIIIALFLNFELINSKLKIENLNPLFSVTFIGFLFIFCYKFYCYIKKSNKKWAIKIFNFFKGIKEGVLSVFKMNKKWEFLIHTAFIWFMYFAMFYVIKWSLAETSLLPLEAIIVGFITGALSVSATNGGIGIYPFSVSIVLVSYGITKEPSIAFGWIIWTSQTLMILVLGCLSFFILPLINRKL